ncbi:MAG TPA: DNA polymerase III subunit delta, partial [Prolixibacteraceae bacterium]|nr:DNA polymerase III subunit delta [Prolixibacteraceae bacterium]
MTYNEILQHLQKRIFHPIYIFMGEEAYFIDSLSDYIANHALREEERSFNQTILYGKDCTADQLLTVARRFPMMAAYQVVILKEAQLMEKLEDNLLGYVEKPLKSTILVICHKYGNLDKRKKFLKAAGENGVVFESKKIYENQLSPWIHKYCSEKGYRIEPQASALLGEYLGTEISKVVNELEKLMILLPSDKPIAPADIEKNIGISKDYNVFELQKALGQRDILKSNRIIQYFGANPNQNPFPKTLSSLYYFFSKLLMINLSNDKSKNAVTRMLGVNPYFVDDFLNAARNYPTPKLVEI